MVNEQKASFDRTPLEPLKSNYLTVQEDIVPVRATDLNHLKRDIKAIPDSSAPNEGAMWTCLGFAIGAFPSCIGTPIQQTSLLVFVSSWCIFILGIAGTIYFFIKDHSVSWGPFHTSSSSAKTQHDDAVDRIIQNIDDYSRNTDTSFHAGSFVI